MIDEKYVVFKRKDWDLWVNTGTMLRQMPKPLEDSVVIRTQDVFAAPALDAYANSIMVACSIMSDVWETDDGHGLKNVADYFHERAVEAWQRQDKKLPD